MEVYFLVEPLLKGPLQPQRYLLIYEETVSKTKAEAGHSVRLFFFIAAKFGARGRVKQGAKPSNVGRMGLRARNEVGDPASQSQ